MNLSELRKNYQVTQQEAASLLKVPLRTYRRYELDDNYGNEMKRKAMIDALVSQYEITEDKGILSVEKIRNIVSAVFDKDYQGQIDFCYLFGSYAKNKAKDESDVDLYVVSSLTGFAFMGLMEKLRTALHKKVDVIRPSELNDNIDLVNEIMKWGIRIYG